MPGPLRLPAAGFLIAVTFYLVGRCTYFAIFTNFQIYDDEGAMLMVLAGLARGRVLYDQVAAMYGPVGFFPKLAVLRLFHLQVDHNVSRTMTWLIYSAGCVAAGAATWRMTRQISSFVLAAFTTYFLLRWMGGESGHPQDQCQFLLALCALLATFAVDRIKRVCLCLAVIGGLIAMTKGNLGIFFLAAFGAALVASFRKGRSRTLLVPACAAALFILPYILLHSHLGLIPVYRFFISVESALMGCFLIALTRANRQDVAIGDLVLYLSCFLGTIAIVCLATLAWGTTLHGLAEGLIYLPLRGSNQFFFFWRQTGWMIPASAIGLAAASVSFLHLKTPLVRESNFLIVISLIRTGVGLVTTKVALFDAAPGQEFLMATLPQFVWLLLMPTTDSDNRTVCSFPRLFMAFLAITETLGSFPNAGTQQAIGLVLPVCVGIVCLYDGLRSLTAAIRDRSIGLVKFVFNACVTVLVLCYGGLHENEQAERYVALPALDLPGSTLIHVSREQLLRLRKIVSTIEANCDSFMTLPGMNSYYFWTGIHPPSYLNVTNWMLLTDQQQQKNFDALQSADRPCVFVDMETAAFWNHASPAAAKALIIRLVAKHYRIGIAQPTWTLLVPNDRKEVVVISDDGKKTSSILPPLSDSSNTDPRR